MAEEKLPEENLLEENVPQEILPEENLPEEILPTEIFIPRSKFKRRLYRCLGFFQCNCRLFCIWFFLSVFSCIIYALIIYFAIVGRASYIPTPTEIPFVHVPLLYNFTIRIATTYESPNKKISGSVYILFRTKNATNYFYLNQGPNLVVNSAEFFHVNGSEELTLLGLRYDSQHEIHTFILDRNFTVNEEYSVAFEFTGEIFDADSDRSPRIYIYESYTEETAYGMFHMKRDYSPTGLRYLIPSLDSLQYPCKFLVRIQRHPSMRSMSNMQMLSSISETPEDYFIDVFNTSLTLFPSQFALAVYNFAYVQTRSNTTNLDIFVYFRTAMEQIISIQRLLQFMNIRTNNIGKLQALVLPNVSTMYQPGIAILNERETIQEALTLDYAAASENS